MMTKTGLTPKSQIRMAVIIRIQQLDKVICDSFASMKVGTAMSATTAGRTPRNMAAIHGTSMN